MTADQINPTEDIDELIRALDKYRTRLRKSPDLGKVPKYEEARKSLKELHQKLVLLPPDENDEEGDACQITCPHCGKDVKVTLA